MKAQKAWYNRDVSQTMEFEKAILIDMIRVENENRQRFTWRRFVPILFLSAVICIFSCNSSSEQSSADTPPKVEEGELKGQSYENEDLDWSIEIPRGWEVMGTDRLEEIDEKGREAMKVDDTDMGKVKRLINFQKDPFNIFYSTAESVDRKDAEFWTENNEAVKLFIYETYSSLGMQVDTASSSMTVNGVLFDGFHAKIYNPSGSIMLEQEVFSTLIDTTNFAVILNYNNLEDKEILHRSFRNSKFGSISN